MVLRADAAADAVGDVEGPLVRMLLLAIVAVAAVVAAAAGDSVA